MDAALGRTREKRAITKATANIAIPAIRTMKGAENPAKVTISGATDKAPKIGPIASTDIARDSQKPMVPFARLCLCSTDDATPDPTLIAILPHKRAGVRPKGIRRTF